MKLGILKPDLQDWQGHSAAFSRLVLSKCQQHIEAPAIPE